MKLLPLLIAPVAALVCLIPAQAEVQTRKVEYKHGNTVLEGYLAYDDDIQGKLPGVMVVHEWTGLGSYVQQRAKQLAELGYVAFAIDMYGKGIRPKNDQEAAAQATIYRSDRKLMRVSEACRRLRAAAGLKVLQQNELTDKNRIAAIRYCFGGGK